MPIAPLSLGPSSLPSFTLILDEPDASTAVWSIQLYFVHGSPSSPPIAAGSPFLTTAPGPAGTKGRRALAVASFPGTNGYQVTATLHSGVDSGGALSGLFGHEPLFSPVIVVDGHPPATPATVTGGVTLPPLPSPRVGKLLWVASGAPAGGDGSLLAPFATLGEAMTYVAAQGTPGWAVNVEPGTYPEHVLVPPIDGLVVVGQGEVIIAPPTNTSPGIEQIAPAGSTLGSLTLRDLIISMPSGGSPALRLEGAAGSSYLAGRGLDLRHLAASSIVLSHVGQGRLDDVRAASLLVQNSSCVAHHLSVATLGIMDSDGCFVTASEVGDVTVSGSQQGIPHTFGGSSLLTSLTALDSPAGPARLIVGPDVVVDGPVTFTNATSQPFNLSSLLEFHGMAAQVTLADVFTALGSLGFYDLRQMRFGSDNAALGPIAISSGNGANPVFDFQGALLADAPAITLSGTMVVDLKQASFLPLNLSASGGATVDRDRVVVGNVTVGPAGVEVPIVPPFPSTILPMPPETALYGVVPTAALGGSPAPLTASARTPASVHLTSPSVATYDVEIVRSPTF